ncbi:thioredoxin domain-containing protein [Cyclospora cayetanensis]|uniref:Thioredoxin domain-containing protein n=1 Tax=Cyclospora cayetanensis TaxID=88456 RepID=A0A1D3D6Z6_9EIME|nr:thioredoxin domain-containing protein [Cyclospora cayetanensis]
METSDKLTQIATNIVLEKAAKDKFSALKQQQLHRVHDPQKNGSAGSQNQEKDEEEPDGEGFDDLSHWREKRMQQLKASSCPLPHSLSLLGLGWTLLAHSEGPDKCVS